MGPCSRSRSGHVRTSSRALESSHKIVAPVKSQRKHPESERARTLRALTDPALLMEEYERIVRDKLEALAYAPVVFLSALTAEHADKLFPLIDKVAAARRHRITTGELNRWVSTVDIERGTSPSSRKIKIYYVTQASTSPPTFILFTNQDKRLHFSYSASSKPSPGILRLHRRAHSLSPARKRTRQKPFQPASWPSKRKAPLKQSSASHFTFESLLPSAPNHSPPALPQAAARALLALPARPRHADGRE